MLRWTRFNEHSKAMENLYPAFQERLRYNYPFSFTSPNCRPLVHPDGLRGNSISQVTGSPTTRPEEFFCARMGFLCLFVYDLFSKLAWCQRGQQLQNTTLSTLSISVVSEQVLCDPAWQKKKKQEAQPCGQTKTKSIFQLALSALHAVKKYFIHFEKNLMGLWPGMLSRIIKALHVTHMRYYKETENEKKY